MVERSIEEFEKQMISFTVEARKGQHYYLNVVGEGKGVMNADSFFGVFPTETSVGIDTGLFVYTHYNDFPRILSKIKNLPIPENLAGINFKVTEGYIARISEQALKQNSPLIVVAVGTYKETKQETIWLFCQKGLNPKEAYFVIRNQCVSLIAKQN